MIRFEHVNKWYSNHFHVLKDISLHVRQGEVVVICGPSGSGKSTLIRVVNRLEPIQEGHVTVDGVDLDDPKTNLIISAGPDAGCIPGDNPVQLPLPIRTGSARPDR